MVHGIEEPLDVQIQQPVHFAVQQARVKSIQRLVLAAPRSKAIGKPEKLFGPSLFSVGSRRFFAPVSRLLTSS